MAMANEQTLPTNLTAARLQAHAIRLATIPMLSGLTCLGIWLLVEWSPLLWMGYGAMGFGILAAMLVPFFLLRSWPLAPDIRKTVFISLLAITNVPVLFFSAVEGMNRLTSLKVVIHNNAGDDWLSVRMAGAGIVDEAATIAANQHETRYAWASNDGRLELHAIENGKPSLFIVDEYVTTNLGGDYTVIRDADGMVTVTLR